MINTHLVLVFLSVYTFEVSKTTFPRQGQCIDAYARPRNACRQERCWLQGFPDWHIHCVATPPKP